MVNHKLWFPIEQFYYTPGDLRYHLKETFPSLVAKFVGQAFGRTLAEILLKVGFHLRRNWSRHKSQKQKRIRVGTRVGRNGMFHPRPYVK